MAQVIMLSGAEADLISLYTLLENRSEGLGDRFYRALDAGLGQLSQQPLSAPVYLTPFRRLKIPQHPFGVFYSVEGDRLMVQAILDLRRNPKWIKRRLRGES